MSPDAVAGEDALRLPADDLHVVRAADGRHHSALHPHRPHPAQGGQRPAAVHHVLRSRLAQETAAHHQDAG